jgi:hypothetical protein
MPRKGTTTERGYGTEHQRLREQLLPHAYGQLCPKCEQPMWEGEELDLGHTEDRTGYTGMEHRSCNRSHGAAEGNRRRAARRHGGQARRAPRHRGYLSVDLDDL